MPPLSSLESINSVSPTTRTRTRARRPRELRIANILLWARCAIFAHVGNGVPLNVDGPGIPRLFDAFFEHQYNITLVENFMLLRDSQDVRSSNSDDAVLQQAAHDAQHLFEESCDRLYHSNSIHAHCASNSSCCCCCEWHSSILVFPHFIYSSWRK
jgi:hypothetical protein